MEEDSEKDYNSDDSTLDETFKPKKKDANFSDSNDQSLSNNSDNKSEEDLDSIPLSLQIKNETRDKGWKLKGKIIKTNRAHKPKRPEMTTSLKEKLYVAKNHTVWRKIQLSPHQPNSSVKIRVTRVLLPTTIRLLLWKFLPPRLRP